MTPSEHKPLGVKLMFTGTIRLRPSINGIRLLGWREDGKRFKPFGTDKVPYQLANFLRLMPKTGDWTDFSNVLYDFSTQEFNELKPDGPIMKVTKRHCCTFLTLDTSK
jgi:hypothetical protein